MLYDSCIHSFIVFIKHLLSAKLFSVAMRHREQLVCSPSDSLSLSPSPLPGQQLSSWGPPRA